MRMVAHCVHEEILVMLAFQLRKCKGHKHWKLTNTQIVPFGPILSKAFDAHINDEFWNTWTERVIKQYFVERQGEARDEIAR